MQPPQFCAFRHKETVNASSKRSSQGKISLHEYAPQDQTIAIELFKEGMLRGINREERPALYERVELFVNTTIPHYDNVPAMVNYGNGGRLFVARDQKGDIVGTIGIIVSNEGLKKKRAELVRVYQRRSEAKESEISSQSPDRTEIICNTSPSIFKNLYGIELNLIQVNL